MQAIKKIILLILVTILVNGLGYSEIIEKIYAVVNGEIITYSELKQFEQGMVGELKNKYQGEELEKKIKEGKEKLLGMLIDQKLVLSKAKEKNYDLDQYVEMVIKEIMKQNNIASIEDLKKALASSGIDYEEFKKIRKNELLTQNLIKEEIGAKIEVDNSELMTHYRQNIAKYTIPAEYSLDCIFLNLDNYFTAAALKAKKEEIDGKLKESGATFEAVAGEYSELPNEENNIFLGNFKKGELHHNIEQAVLKMKEGDISSWIETGNGWYIIRLTKLKPAKVKEYKEVRDEIEEFIRNEKMEAKLKDYIEQIKKESHIKIYEEYK